MSDAVAIGKVPFPHSRLVSIKPRSRVTFGDSLVTICRQTIVDNLERYPPQALGILNPEEWDELIQLKHKASQPKKGSGGLDGTGRMTPVVRHCFMASVEDANPSFANSEITDRLVWKDCTEFRFRRGGLLRPEVSEVPFPLLVERISRYGEELQTSAHRSEPVHGEIEACTRNLLECPMSVRLLKETGIGKILRSVLKKNRHSIVKSQAQTLDCLLKLWRQLAVGEEAISENLSKDSLEAKWTERFLEQKDDLLMVESCESWRLLFRFLLDREERSRNSQGKRMREIRKSLSKDRPKIVKVRTATNSRQEKILGGRQAVKTCPGNKKIAQLRMEASVTSSRRPTSQPPRPRTAAFSNAVAFATGKKTGTGKRLANGKLLKIPPAKLRRR